MSNPYLSEQCNCPTTGWQQNPEWSDWAATEDADGIDCCVLDWPNELCVNIYVELPQISEEEELTPTTTDCVSCPAGAPGEWVASITNLAYGDSLSMTFVQNLHIKHVDGCVWIGDARANRGVKLTRYATGWALIAYSAGIITTGFVYDTDCCPESLEFETDLYSTAGQVVITLTALGVCPLPPPPPPPVGPPPPPAPPPPPPALVGTTLTVTATYNNAIDFPGWELSYATEDGSFSINGVLRCCSTATPRQNSYLYFFGSARSVGQDTCCRYKTKKDDPCSADIINDQKIIGFDGVNKYESLLLRVGCTNMQMNISGTPCPEGPCNADGESTDLAPPICAYIEGLTGPMNIYNGYWEFGAADSGTYTPNGIAMYGTQGLFMSGYKIGVYNEYSSIFSASLVVTCVDDKWCWGVSFSAYGGLSGVGIAAEGLMTTPSAWCTDSLVDVLPHTFTSDDIVGIYGSEISEDAQITLTNVPCPAFCEYDFTNPPPGYLPLPTSYCVDFGSSDPVISGARTVTFQPGAGWRDLQWWAEVKTAPITGMPYWKTALSAEMHPCTGELVWRASTPALYRYDSVCTASLYFNEDNWNGYGSVAFSQSAPTEGSYCSIYQEQHGPGSITVSSTGCEVSPPSPLPPPVPPSPFWCVKEYGPFGAGCAGAPIGPYIEYCVESLTDPDATCVAIGTPGLYVYYEKNSGPYDDIVECNAACSMPPPPPPPPVGPPPPPPPPVGIETYCVYADGGPYELEMSTPTTWLDLLGNVLSRSDDDWSLSFNGLGEYITASWNGEGSRGFTYSSGASYGTVTVTEGVCSFSPPPPPPPPVSCLGTQYCLNNGTDIGTWTQVLAGSYENGSYPTWSLLQGGTAPNYTWAIDIDSPDHHYEPTGGGTWNGCGSKDFARIGGTGDPMSVPSTIVVTEGAC